MTKRFTSRTAALMYKTCPFKRYLTFHQNGTGLVSQGESLSLLVGSSIHRGLQHLLEHCRLEHPTGGFEENCINTAVEFAINLFREALSNNSLGGLRKDEPNNLVFIIEEHEALIEALVRAFAIQRLSNLLEEYEVLEVEHEEVFEDFSDLVIFLGKADGLFRRRIDNKLIILSIKTASEYADVTLRNILHDMQNASEWFIIQDRINKSFNTYCKDVQINSFDDEEEFKAKMDSYGSHLTNYFQTLVENNEKPEIYAVQYEHLITGLYRDFSKTGIRTRQSFLIHPSKLEVMGGYNIFSKRQTFEPDEYKWKTGVGKLAKGWSKINIWEDIGVKLWIDMLAMGQIQPEEGNPLEEVIRTSELVIVSPEVREEWLFSTSYQEETIARYLSVLDDMEFNDPDEEAKQYKRAIQEYFPKNTMQCHDYYGHDCEFVPLCHYGVSIEETQHLYQIRKPHHNLEKESFDEKGLTK